jgi:predicted GNAT family N-acyltransferase
VAAAAFYEKHGFKKDGTEFVEAGIPHIRMMKCMDR